MQKSPVLRPGQEPHSLNLIPSETLTQHFEQALERLVRDLGEQVGAYLEFGVYNGSSMLCMREALRRVGLPGIAIYGFDSFHGLPASAVEEDGGVWHAGQFTCPRAIAEERLAPLTGNANSITLVEGWFADTLSGGDRYGVGAASIVMIDSDAYSSARQALHFIAPLLTDPAILFFDDWKLNDLDVKGMGEYRAFHEWAAQYPEMRWTTLPSYNRKSRVLLLRRRK
jgi:hypothetical protein